MSKKCKHTRIRDGYEILCGSYAFNLWQEDIDQGELCDRHYWQGRTEQAEAERDELKADNKALLKRIEVLGRSNVELEAIMKKGGCICGVYMKEAQG